MLVSCKILETRATTPSSEILAAGLIRRKPFGERPIKDFATKVLRAHSPEYLIEGALLGMFMIAACFFSLLLEHHASPLRAALPDSFTRRLLMGTAMGATAIALIHSPWGKRSGAHMNPAVTLTFWRLGKVRTPDAIYYIIFQFAGGIAGMIIAGLLAGSALKDASVNFVATLPGIGGPPAAWIAEFGISFLLMLHVLMLSNNKRLCPYTGRVAGILVALYISAVGPISGMSMNPARTLASALFAGGLGTLWIYFTAPVLGMLAAAEVYTRFPVAARVYCAKLHHTNSQRCIFTCRFAELMGLEIHRGCGIQDKPQIIGGQEA